MSLPSMIPNGKPVWEDKGVSHNTHIWHYNFAKDVVLRLPVPIRPTTLTFCAQVFTLTANGLPDDVVATVFIPADYAKMPIDALQQHAIIAMADKILAIEHSHAQIRQALMRDTKTESIAGIYDALRTVTANERKRK